MKVKFLQNKEETFHLVLVEAKSSLEAETGL